MPQADGSPTAQIPLPIPAYMLGHNIRRHWGQSITEVVQGTPEALIEQNAFYLQLKLTLGQCNQEIATIKAASVSQKKEFEDLKARTMIKEFAQEYHTMKAGGGDGANQTLTLAGVLPYPETSTHEEKPEVVHWI
ncbi:hypothetical protein EI94DRAFT_1705640 [Lactarius quietus]|nr:hypothetical protein EI94DRAFT_1705640 [Lactarius quietus]